MLRISKIADLQEGPCVWGPIPVQQQVLKLQIAICNTLQANQL